MIVTKFYIQQHFTYSKNKGTERIHFDLRIQETPKSKVLKSWAVPKGVPLTKADGRRLAIPVEDHPLSYGPFEGEITEGYGKGIVKQYDSGFVGILEWESDKIKIVFNGQKIRGKYVLIKIGDNWNILKWGGDI